jgi:hypothetical protein
MTAETPRTQDSRSPASIQNDNAALRGASLAFGKPPVKPKPKIDNTYSGNNGALAAATKAGGNPPSRNTSMSRWEAEEQRLAHQRTGGSNASGYAGDLDRIQQRLSQLDRGGNGFLQLPGLGQDKSHSPSFIAASLAASRSASTSVSPNHTGQQQLSAAALKRQSSFTRRSPGRSTGSTRSLSSKGSEDHILDTSSIPPTTSLIGMFEQNAAAQTQNRPALRRSATSATVKPPPSPQRSIPARSPFPEPLIVKSSKPPEVKSPKPSLARPILTSLKPNDTNAPPTAPNPSLPTSKPIPIPSKPGPPQMLNEDDGASSDDSFVSATDYKPSWRATLQNQNRGLTSTSTQSINTVDSLANAIVASSLASSRAASPSRSLQSNSLYPPPPPPRRSPHKHLFHNSKEISRTPSPAKQGVLRTTMRKPKPDEEIDEGELRRKKKAHLMKKHPNKHHEGDRKRWRDEITERERKRYEAVWASNKGLYTSPGMEGSVCSLVVRDIFSRSRLHTDVLEEVYALVDRKQNGGLEREEFVVGFWLIDQWLKGRKLPVKVSDSVWKSVGVLGGIKIRKAGK